MRHRLLRIAVLAEGVAILCSQYATAQARVLWLVVAAVVYWLIARGARAVHALQFVVAIIGAVVTAVAGAWMVIAYAVEAVALATLWQRDAGSGSHG